MDHQSSMFTILSITRPESVPILIKHRTEHYIQTKTGPSITARSRRLATTEQKKAKKEFKALIQDSKTIKKFLVVPTTDGSKKVHRCLENMQRLLCIEIPHDNVTQCDTFKTSP